MPFYRYVVTDKAGKTLHGTMNAADEVELRGRLVSMGYTVVSTATSGTGQLVPATAPVRHASVEGVPPSLEPLIPMRLLATYLRQMASMIRSGMTPYQANHEIRTRTRNRRLGKALEDMEAQVQRGGHLAPVMTAHPGVFPTKIVGLIYCGELGGFLDGALDESASDVEREVSARLWPRLVAGFLRCYIVLGLLMLPFMRMGAWMSQMMEGASPAVVFRQTFIQGLTHFSIPIIIIFLGATYAWPHIKRVPSVRAWLDRFIATVPIWGPLHVSRALLRFARSLEQLYSAGINPSTAWTAASSTCPNSYVANRLRQAGAGLNTGGTLSDAVELANVFDDDSKALLLAGERSGDLPDMLRKIAEAQDALASTYHRRGRWLSSGLSITGFILVGGVLMIIMAHSYAGFLMQLINDIPGGG